MRNIKDNTLEFPFVIAKILAFLEPVLDAMVNEEEMQRQWKYKDERSSNL